MKLVSGDLPATPAWLPDSRVLTGSNVGEVARHLGLGGLDGLHRWSIDHRAEFWALVIDRLGIQFRTPPLAVLGEASTPDKPVWLPGAGLNIVESCLRHERGRVALVAAEGGTLRSFTYGELGDRVVSFAAALAALGVGPGDPVAIAMTMNWQSVVAYLGIVYAGGVVVSIADSFAPEEIATRLSIAGAGTVVTQGRLVRGGRELPMYEKVVAAGASRAIVVDAESGPRLRGGDVPWEAMEGQGPADPHVASTEEWTNILFSSGTTGEPKAIPWTHVTPIKSAMDAHFHHDVHRSDVLAWPTNLGWMMGPWLIYAALLNGAAFALHDDQPTDRKFGKFVQDAGVTMLGVVPSLVATWRASGCLEGLDWSGIERFSSTGEASNPDDMTWLMDHAGRKPVLEYCGGTEVGGGYLCGSMVQPAIASMFSTPALGIDLRILDAEGEPADSGEVFLVGPSIGFSTELLNRDHHALYYEGTPSAGEVLRRHGDHIERLPGGYFRALGRIDDTMNLGGIKVSSAELERVISAVSGVAEVAAVAVPPPGGGPSRLVVYAVPDPGADLDPADCRQAMQALVRGRLNPLFKIHEVVVLEALPRTASQKVMRRALRARYSES